MIESVDIVGYGRPATTALANVIAGAKQAGPLAPITVVVPSNFVGLSARRLLGSGRFDDAGLRGIANVSFLTPFRLAELVGADLLLEQRPITNPVLGAAVRRVLSDDPDRYRAVADHESTEAALAALFAELSNVDEAGLEAIADEGSRTAELAVTFHRRIGQHLAGFHTEHDLATAAANRADLEARLAPMGHVVWYLPTPVTPAIGAFLGEVVRRAPSASVIVGITGVEAADQPVWRACEAVGVVPSNQAVSTPTADAIVSVTDAPEEIREVSRRIVALVEDGVDLARIGVFFPTPDPYVRILEQQLAAAGLPANGPDPRRLADSVAGRTLLGALALPAARWRRDRVIDVASGGPLRFGDESIRPTVWDELSRSAGVVIDHGDWRRKLDHDRVVSEARIAELSTDDVADNGRSIRRLRDRIADGGQLVAFVDALRDSIRKVERAVSWSEKCFAAGELLRSLLGAEHTHGSWPDDEQVAFARIEDALDRLASLGGIEPEPTQAVFVRALRAELDVARGRRGRFGRGVVYGPIATAVGHDLDAVFVVGCAEGLLPQPRRDDAILPDALRIRSLDQLEPKALRLQHQHRAFLAALGAAPPGRRTLTFLRGDLRSNRRALPSRWLLDSASALSGRTVYATDFDALGDDVVDHVGSFAAAIANGDASTVSERDLGAFVDGSTTHEGAWVPLVGRGLDAQRSRASTAFTEFDGNLGDRVDADDFPLPRIGDRPLSPSRLERWAGCGLQYFLQYVLEVSDRDDPERTEALSALDRGVLIHEALERFVAEALDSGAPIPTEAWSAASVSRLHEIADDVCQEYEAAGRTGRRANWRVQRDDVHDLLDAFVVADNAFRAGHGATPRHVELDLGVTSGSVVSVDLANGTTVALRGKVDRVDTTSDGRVLVNDYKSGRSQKYRELDTDPFMGGTTLQLGMYAEGAMAVTGAADAEAHYWLVEAGRRHGYAWTAEKQVRFREVLTAITTGIGAGVFAADPGEWDSWRQTNKNCRYCDFDTVCVRERGDQAVAKADAPELAVRDALHPAADEVDR